MSDQCPCCGSTDTEVVQEQWDYTPPFGNTVKYPHRFLRCNTCTESICWDTQEDDAIGEKIRLDADKATVGPMLDFLNGLGLIDVNIDRMLCLDIGTVKKQWRVGNITRGEVTLLRILRAFPWLLDVADEHFSDGAVKNFVAIIEDAMLNKRKSLDYGSAHEQDTTKYHGVALSHDIEGRYDVVKIVVDEEDLEKEE